MIFRESKLSGVFIIETEKKDDGRGFFARIWDFEKFKEKGLNTKIAQCNMSYTKRKGTIRGLHYQTHPYEEAKLIRCTKGKIFDVIVDLRKGSPTFKKWEGFELSGENYRMLYVPEGLAHGFQTLEDDTEVYYQVSQFFTPNSEKGIIWNDPELKITWPIPVSVISEKDASWEPLQDA